MCQATGSFAYIRSTIFSAHQKDTPANAIERESSVNMAKKFSISSSEFHDAIHPSFTFFPLAY